MLVDTHCHLDAREFDRDRGGVMARARAAGVTTQVIPAITLAGFEDLRRLCDGTPGLHPAWGLHPLFLAEHAPEHLRALRDWLERERPVAVGECGLDFYVDGLDRDLQQDYFLRQLELAREFGLPVIIHARRAVEAVIKAIRATGGLRGVVHSFSGSAEQAAQLFRLGFHLGIGGPVTYPRARRLRAVVATMPAEWLLLETDAPDQPLHGHQGERNEPARLADVLQVVATLRDEEPAALAAATSRNARALFGLD